MPNLSTVLIGGQRAPLAECLLKVVLANEPEYALGLHDPYRTTGDISQKFKNTVPLFAPKSRRVYNRYFVKERHKK